MAERVMLVCDTCGRPAIETVTFKASAGNRQRDYCSTHLDELLSGARVPKRGRKPGSTNRKPAAKKTAAKKSSNGRRKNASRKTTAKV
jgi:hypothetical protein